LESSAGEGNAAIVPRLKENPLFAKKKSAPGGVNTSKKRQRKKKTVGDNSLFLDGLPAVNDFPATFKGFVKNDTDRDLRFDVYFILKSSCCNHPLVDNLDQPFNATHYQERHWHCKNCNEAKNFYTARNKNGRWALDPFVLIYSNGAYNGSFYIGEQRFTEWFAAVGEKFCNLDPLKQALVFHELYSQIEKIAFNFAPDARTF
jgi:hypothetical protein